MTRAPYQVGLRIGEDGRTVEDLVRDEHGSPLAWVFGADHRPLTGVELPLVQNVPPDVEVAAETWLNEHRGRSQRHRARYGRPFSRRLHDTMASVVDEHIRVREHGQLDGTIDRMETFRSDGVAISGGSMCAVGLSDSFVTG